MHTNTAVVERNVVYCVGWLIWLCVAVNKWETANLQYALVYTVTARTVYRVKENESRVELNWVGWVYVRHTESTQKKSSQST